MFGEATQSLCLAFVLSLLQAYQSQGCHSQSPTLPANDQNRIDGPRRPAMRPGGRSLPIMITAMRYPKSKTLKLDHCMEKSVKGKGHIRRRLMKKTKLMDIMTMGEELHYRRLLLLISRTRECKFYWRICQTFEECIIEHNNPDWGHDPEEIASDDVIP